ncbi:MAG: efflux transporter periplasmic adaptor subunit, partial [Bacteroidota bacterium]
MKKVVFISVLALTALLYACSGNNAQAPAAAQAQPLPVYEVAAHDAFTWQEYPVTLEGRTDVEIRPQVDGYLQK